MSTVRELALEARRAFYELAKLPRSIKDKALMEMADTIWREKDRLLEAALTDVKSAQAEVEAGRLTKPVLERLKLDEVKLKAMVDMVKSVAALDDPVGKTLYAVELDDGFELYKVTCPLGVIGVVFEARPDVLPQISSLCLKSGNAVILKGGREAANINRALYTVIKESTERVGIPRGWIQLLEAREEIMELLKQDDLVDLIVPRGSNEFVRFVQENTRIPVLGHSSGVCQIYVDKAADITKAVEVCFDAKVQYPAVCNAVECILVHKDVAHTFLPKLAEWFSKAGVEMRCCPRAKEALSGFNVRDATEEDWGREYLDLKVALRVVDSLEEAVDYINKYGSKHTDAIITEDRSAASRFIAGVDSSTVIHNASTRFSDGYRFGLGAEVGISTSKIHARGPVGLEGLVTYKYILLGDGQKVSTYIGANAKKFKHKRLDKTWTPSE
ncbi:MAG: glutamate-5-semialdehyde dehydrogenase [Nitrososphaerales archaeon]